MARRSGLGKGLGALLPTEVVGDRRSALREVPISSIRPNALQPRSHFDEEAMSSLAASIRELGVLQPILVREVDGEAESYELIAGSGAGGRRAGPAFRPSRSLSRRPRATSTASNRHLSRTSTGLTSTHSRRQRPTSS